MGVVASWLAEFLIKHGQPVRFIDGDPVNRSFGQYKAFAAEKLDLLNADGVLDRTRYDGLVERFLAENAVFVLDSGATAFLPFWSYLVEADLVATLRAAVRRVYVHVPIAGGWSKRRLYEGNTWEQRVQVTAQPAPTAALTKITGLRLASPSMRCHLRFAMPREESKVWRMRYRDKDGVRQRESTFTEDWDEAQKRLRERLQGRDNNTLPALRRGQDLKFGEWSDFYLENFSKPPFRAPKTHEVNQRALKHLRKVFENTKLGELTADDIEMYLRRLLKQRVLVRRRTDS